MCEEVGLPPIAGVKSFRVALISSVQHCNCALPSNWFVSKDCSYYPLVRLCIFSGQVTREPVYFLHGKMLHWGYSFSHRHAFEYGVAAMNVTASVFIWLFWFPQQGSEVGLGRPP